MSSSSLADRSSLLASLQKDLELKRSACDTLEENLQLEKVSCCQFCFSRSYCCCWHDTVICQSVPLPVRLSVTLCIVAIRYIIQQKRLNKWVGRDPRKSEHDFTTFSLTLRHQTNVDVGAIWRIN